MRKFFLSSLRLVSSSPFTFINFFSLSLKTDDFGVFKTSLSNELQICAETFRLSEADIMKLTVQANQSSFANDLERQLISDKIKSFQQEFNHINWEIRLGKLIDYFRIILTLFYESKKFVNIWNYIKKNIGFIKIWHSNVLWRRSHEICDLIQLLISGNV